MKYPPQKIEGANGCSPTRTESQPTQKMEVVSALPGVTRRLFLFGGMATVLAGKALPGRGESEGGQYSVPREALEICEKAVAQAVAIRDRVLLALARISVGDAVNDLQNLLVLIDGQSGAKGVLELARELERIAKQNRWTEVTFALSNVIPFYDLQARKHWQTAMDLGRRAAPPSAAVPVEMKNEMRALFAFATAALGSCEDKFTPVTAGGLRTIWDFLNKQISL